jgi:hypothetical protein
MAYSSTLAYKSGISSNKPPLFDGTNYTHWKYLMEIHLQCIDLDLWEIIINGPNIPLKKNEKNEDVPKERSEYTKDDKAQISQNKKALSILLCSLSAHEHSRVIGCKEARDVWKKLEVIDEGTTQVKHSKISMLFHEYESFKMKQGEKVTEMAERFNTIINQLTLLGNQIPEQQQVDKILRSLTRIWQPKVIAICEVRPLKELTMDELIGNLLTHEINMNELDKEEGKLKKPIALVSNDDTSSDSENDDFALFVRKFKKFNKERKLRKGKPNVKKENYKCYRCGSKEHFIADCPQKEERKKGEVKVQDKKNKKSLKADT